MKLSEHATEQLNERYLKWGLDIYEALSIIESLENGDDIYRMILIGDIPIVLICDFNEIITIYPHPLDAAENWVELIEKVKRQKESISSIRNALNLANNCNNKKQRYIKKIEKQNKHLKQKMKGMWE